ncbi:unnamed protein product, partial [Soboliphyme baturini]|uniref:Origin recognition complex subunit 2 n=1 Tax=Soboliphyme baturini TaxID=241478 RepID=A0A183J3U1_9BILA
MPVLRSGKRSKSVGFRVREESIQQTKKVYLSYLGIETSASETGESDADSGSNSFQNFGVRESKAFLQEYFSQSTKVLTTDEDEEAGESEHGSTLNVPFAALREWLQVADQKLPKSAKQLSQLYESQFDKWMVYMSENFNVLLYGFGSKLDLVERFRKAKLLGTYNHIVLHGYQPSASVKQLLALLVERLRLKISPSSSSSPIELSYAVCQALESMKKPCDVFIVVHNIDGVALRNHVAQTVLCVLADSPFVHIIASVDHVNAALMWDQTKLAKFSW